MTRKEELYITCIKNLQKTVKFLNLENQLETKGISEEEYYGELHDNLDKYIIDVEILNNETDLKLVQEIISELDIEVNYDDIWTLFSIDFKI